MLPSRSTLKAVYLEYIDKGKYISTVKAVYLEHIGKGVPFPGMYFPYCLVCKQWGLSNLVWQMSDQEGSWLVIVWQWSAIVILSYTENRM